MPAEHAALDFAPANAPVNAPAKSLVPSQFIDRKRLDELAAKHAASHQAAKPFPYSVIDGFFPPELLDAVIADLPSESESWTNYDNPQERKRVFSNVDAFQPAAECMVHALNSLPVIRFIEKLTGIDGIIADPYLHAAGYMKVEPGGFLELHTDFTMHRRLALERRVNVLIYLNHDWKPEYGGQLELHSSDRLDDPKHQEILIEPIFNRMVIFNTPNALHGHRHPVACPPDRARLLFSCFYFTVPPLLGYHALDYKVGFPGQRSFKRGVIDWANRLVPPIVFDLFKGSK